MDEELFDLTTEETIELIAEEVVETEVNAQDMQQDFDIEEETEE